MRKNRTIADCVAGVKVMAKVMKGEKMEVKKVRKPRAVENEKRDMGEKRLELSIILNLQLHGYTVSKSGEQSTYSSRYVLVGMADLQVFIEGFGVVYMEVKQPCYKTAKDGGLRQAQIRFRELCQRCNLKHFVVYSLSDAFTAVKSITAEQGSSCDENLSKPTSSGCSLNADLNACGSDLER